VTAETGAWDAASRAVCYFDSLATVAETLFSPPLYPYYILGALDPLIYVTYFGPPPIGTELLYHHTYNFSIVLLPVLSSFNPFIRLRILSSICLGFHFISFHIIVCLRTISFIVSSLHTSFFKSHHLILWVGGVTESPYIAVRWGGRRRARVPYTLP
jgi:hypothetical protein